jgi:hypothetical protein
MFGPKCLCMYVLDWNACDDQRSEIMYCNMHINSD